jgi:hypothetical protein
MPLAVKKMIIHPKLVANSGSVTPKSMIGPSRPRKPSAVIDIVNVGITLVEGKGSMAKTANKKLIRQKARQREFASTLTFLS